MATFMRRCATTLTVTVACVTAVPGAAQETIEPQDVFALVSELAEDVEGLRFAMGKPIDQRPAIAVSDVEPREVYFQAVTLFSKADQLCEEQGVESGPALPPAPQVSELRPADVLEVVQAAQERIKRVRGIMGVPSEAVLPERDPSKTPTDVFITIVSANRQLSLLLERQLSPRAVYQQVNRGVFYASEILALMPGTRPMPPPPNVEPGRRPAHVYGRLVEVFDRLHIVADTWNVPMLSFQPAMYRTGDDVVPSDVYDVATLLLLELVYLHSLVEGAPTPLDAPYPEAKWPTQVYQLAGILLHQVSQLGLKARENPDFLKSEKGMR